jgi:hypothetical protein
VKTPVLTLLVALAVLCGRSVAADKPAATAEINLPRTYDKLVNEKKLVVGFIGASVMAGAAATSAEKTSWRALVTQALQAQYPDAKIEAVNTSVGGRGADYANFHFKFDTLPKKPDLIFTDAYCNGPYGDEEVHCNEGLIRQIRKALPNAEIVFVYIYKKSGGGVDRFYVKGKMAESQLHELCGHYGTPGRRPCQGSLRCLPGKARRSPTRRRGPSKRRWPQDLCRCGAAVPQAAYRQGQHRCAANAAALQT